MRLINCVTLQLEEFIGEKIPQYAILSHTWGNEEVSFADFTLNQSIAKEGYGKITLTCKHALEDGLGYAWVDTCCIDKSSSAELSEAINSMFAWYKKSTKCYAYLSDVLKADFKESFPKSRWFTRGWTLQELIAPEDVIFYDRDWNNLGTKLERIDWISDITVVDKAALMMRRAKYGVKIELDYFCVAKKMSWASNRETTRVEDMAYCLLGIFNIHMPLLYGEGKQAFIRLQEEIISNTADDSILAWGLHTEMLDSLGRVPAIVAHQMKPKSSFEPILANSPENFRDCGGLEYASLPYKSAAFTMTNLGLEIQLPLVPVRGSFRYELGGQYDGFGWVGLLSCSLGRQFEFLGIFLIPNVGAPDSSMVLRRIGILRDFTFSNLEKVCDGGIFDPGSSKFHTLVVGSRAAAHAITENVTIAKDDGQKRAYEHYDDFSQVIVSESKALQDAGYHVVNGTGFIEDRGLYYTPSWDPVTMSLTRDGVLESEEMLIFTFESQWSGSNVGFTVFIRTDTRRTTVREGLITSEDDKYSFYKYLKGQSQQDSEEGITVRDSQGSSFQIAVTIDKNEVYGWKIIEVKVDAIRLTNDVSMEWESSVERGLDVAR